MPDEDRILSFLKMTGPTLPTKVAKHIGTEIIIASAHLSDLASRGKVKISKLKVGGSPLYYLPGQEEQLYPFAAGNINPKDLMVLDIIKERGMLREMEQDLLTRVALRSLKDFAIPLQVNYLDQTELFWKWHLLSDEEANKRIAGLLNGRNSEAETEKSMNQKTVSPELPIALQKQASLMTIPPAQDSISSPSAVLGRSSPGDDRNNLLAESSGQKTLFSSPILSDHFLPEEKTDHQPASERQKHDAKKHAVKKAEVKPKKKVEGDDPFLPLLERFFSGLRIKVEQKETLRKNAELNFILEVPTAVGKMKYFCKAKNKGRCDEKDLSAAYMEAQMKKLPLLFLYSTEINKKAQEMVESGAFENITVRKVEHGPAI